MEEKTNDFFFEIVPFVTMVHRMVYYRVKRAVLRTSRHPAYRKLEGYPFHRIRARQVPK